MSASESFSPPLAARGALTVEVPRLLTAGEVAELLRVPRSTVYELARARRIPFVKVGRRTLFVPQALREWIAAQSVPPVTEGTGSTSGAKAAATSAASSSRGT
jgi:excisionase family DNA binding protein